MQLEPNIHIDNSKLNQVENLNFLCIVWILDQNFSWDKHVDHCSK